MIIRGVNGQRRELFGLFDTSIPIPRPSQWGSTLAHSGERINMASAAGLPAFLRGVRLISETAAGLPMVVYDDRGTVRAPVDNAPQLEILRRPNPDAPSPFAVWQYTFASMLSGNAYLYKVKTRRMGLKYVYPVNPLCVEADYSGVTPVFKLKDREYGPVVAEVGRDQIIHIPGILLNDPYVGVSVVEAHRHTLGNELGRQRFEGRYIQNDASPGTVLEHAGPGSPTLDQRREVRSSFEARHAGPDRAGRVGMVWGGWKVNHAPVHLTDAQFIESRRFSVQDIGRMLGVPSGLLNDPEAPGGDSPERENLRFLQHGLKPWMDRFTGAISADMDLFPQVGRCVGFNDQGFLQADLLTRWNAYRLGRQGGWVTANEIRGREGLPPVDGGDEIQQTPVGGAANDGGTGSGSNTDAGGGSDA